ncbi:folylpolyglutamate synthase [Firmicutes bacterium CAG:313]|nr:folylpolyglutamate synthase [Firmicutes bacterium CAG:313]
MNYFVDAKSFIEWVQSQKRFSKKTNLDNMKYFCKLLCNPESSFKAIHVTGTNGKGSTVAMLTSVLMAKGYNVGTFTSPYIECFNERIAFNTKPIDDDDLLKMANRVIEIYPILEENNFPKPTFFEFITLCAFCYFKSLNNLDYAVIEVGMGGRLDSTNVITPIVSIITNVALDHMQILGNTKEAILIEKLGIVKDNIPVVCGLKEENLKMIATNVANIHNSQIVFPKYNEVKNVKCDLSDTCFTYQGQDYQLSLLGFHQVENALLVIETYNLLKDDLKLSIQDLHNGLKNTKWVGRLEKINDDPVIYIDGGHNIDGISRITEFVKSLNIPNVRAVISISHDKELLPMIKMVDETFDEIIFTSYTYARSAKAEDLYNLSSSKNKKCIENLDVAVKYVLTNKKPITVFLGSLYLASEIRNKLKK